MGIYINGRRVDQIYYGSLPIAAVYTQGQRIWPENISPIIKDILSCFAAGYWIDNYPWTNDLPWED
jgi:hypothetical protein